MVLVLVVMGVVALSDGVCCCRLVGVSMMVRSERQWLVVVAVTLAIRKEKRLAWRSVCLRC